MITKEFRDIEDHDDISIPRSSLKAACWIRDADTATITLLKLFLFHGIVKSGDFDEIYALISDLAGNNKSLKRKGYPQVHLFFSNNPTDDSKIVFGQIGFRILNPSFNTRNLIDARKLATEIKNIFGQLSGYAWEKGKTYYSYCEWERGYQFQILSASESNVKSLITKVLNLQDHTPNWTYLNKIENDSPTETFPETTHSITILENTVKEPVLRPRVTVRFKYATLTIPPHKPIVLFDLSGKRLDVLIE